MTKTIAIAGKGGTGKTTVSSLLAQWLSRYGTVLAVDADPAANLHMTLGMALETTVGNIREDMLEEVKHGTFRAGISKQDYLELKIYESIVEGEKIDLLAIGRPEGPGCYCAANNMLRGYLDRLHRNYDYLVIDNEAGMEHISRQTTRDVDFLILVSDPTIRGLSTAARMRDLIYELRTSVGQVVLIVNRVQGELPPAVQEAIDEHGLQLLGILPNHTPIQGFDAEGRPLVELPEEDPLRGRIIEMAKELGLP
ncbi:MAG: AAA family ATPase [Chloroflexia bacterium]|nr:AAA family ATPase [Chloroflexia bacterium]